MKLSKLTLALVTAFFLIPDTSVQAQTLSKLNSQAKAIQTYTKAVKSEFRAHYKNNRAFGHLDSHVDEIMEGANIVELETRKDNFDKAKLLNRLNLMDDQVDHINDLVSDVNRGVYGYVGHGLKHVSLKVNSMDIAIADMTRMTKTFIQGPQKSDCTCPKTAAQNTQVPRNTYPIASTTPKKVKTESTWDRFLRWLGLIVEDNHEDDHDHGHSHGTFSHYDNHRH